MSTHALVLASSNLGKLAEFAQLLAPYHVTIYPQSKFVASGADETGATFRDNALLKARHASQASGLPAIADDSGLEVDALGGAPGVYSARFAGAQASDADNNRKLIADLQGVPRSERAARFRCVLAYVRSATDSAPLLADGVWEGLVLDAPRGAGGFGYDSLFLPNAGVLSAAELSREAKNAISHRGLALRAMLELLIANGELRV
jgi:XTP/dITP diphosphohydrolase